MPHSLSRRLSTAAGAVALVAFVAGCTMPSTAPNPVAPTSTPVATAPSESTPTPVSSGAQLADAYIERERFMAEQQLPLDGSPLVAVTDAQKQFIAEQRAHTESLGGAWTPQHESVALALTADACETAILNNHDVDADRFRFHVRTSPIFPALLEGLEKDQADSGERNVASIMVFGMQFLCPEDAPQWEDAFREVYD